MIWGWLHRNPRLVDVSLVAFLLLLGLGAAAQHTHGRTAALVLAPIETLPLLMRRRWPVAVTLAVATVALALIALDAWLLPLQLGVALYTLTSLRDTRHDRTIGGAVICAVAVAALAAGGLEFGAAAARVVFLIAAAALGDSIGSRRAYVRAIEEKAARLEREQDNERRRATAEEQARIARELHDVIAHALSVIAVQAGAADDVFDRDPARAREPIRAVATAARAALADLRHVLGNLKEPVDYEPQAGLAQLDALIERVRATGLPVSLEIEGAPRPVPAAVGLSAYRIVQEALTNSLKHAAAEHIRVRLRYARVLELEVRDDGRGCDRGPLAHGNGITGMRERVVLLGGTLAAGTVAGGGFRVAARIPFDAPS